MKKCNKCQTYLDESQFFRHRTGSWVGLKSQCKKCHSIVSNAARHRREDKIGMSHARARSKAAIDAYGGKCVSCGCDYHPVLCLDHIHNDGHVYRRVSKSPVCCWARANDYPGDVLQVLCHNCNIAKHRNGGVLDEKMRNYAAMSRVYSLREYACA